MLQAVTDALSNVIQWIQIVVQALLGSGTGEGATAGALAPLLPLFAIGVAISAFLLAIKAIKSLIWGA